MNFTAANPNPYSNATSDNTGPNLILASVVGINFVSGLLIHPYILWLICKGKGSGISAEFFSLNLALCEIFFCLLSLTNVFYIWDSRLLYVAGFSLALPHFGRPLFQCLICTERYLAVLHPVSFLKYKPLRYRLACSALVWATVLGFCVFSSLSLGNHNFDVFLHVLMPLSLLLFTISLLCSLAILQALKHPKAGQKGKDREQANNIKRKAIHFILIVTLSMFIQSVPVCTVGFLYAALSAGHFVLLWSITNAVSTMMAYVSPALYIYRVTRG